MLPRIDLVGRLVADPVMTYSTSQTAVVKITIACSEKYKDKESTCFLPAVCFGKIGEALNKHFRKGKPIIVWGKLKTDQWTTTDGQNRSKQQMMIEGWEFTPTDNTRTEQNLEDNSNVDDVPF